MRRKTTKKLLAALLLLLFSLSGCATKAPISTTPAQTPRSNPSPAANHNTEALSKPASGHTESIALWRAKGNFFLGLYQSNGQPPRWETLGSLPLPKATNWQILPSKRKDTVWLLSEDKAGWDFWTLNLQTQKLTKVFRLKHNLGAPLVDSTWQSDKASVVLQDDSDANAPCWRWLNVRTRQIQDLVCATGKNAILSGKNTAFPLGWLDEHTLYGLHWGVTTTPATPGSPNVHSTGKWSLLLWDVNSKQVQKLALPALPSSYRHPDVLLAKAQRTGPHEVTLTALASAPAEDQQCSAFVVTTIWDTMQHTQRAKPATRCLSFPAMETFIAGNYRIWMEIDHAKHIGRGLVVEQEGKIVARFTLPAFWHWAWPWQGANRPQMWKNGLVLKAAKMTTPESLGALYWLPLNGTKVQQIPFPAPPQEAMPNGERVDFLIVGSP